MTGDKSFSRNFQTIPRRFEGMSLQSIGYVPRKSGRVDRVFASFNYSIILSGCGTYECEDVQCAVVSPCVITQLPGLRATYGPSPGTTWDELYFILPPAKLVWMESRRLLGENRFMWPIRNLPAVVRSIRALSSIIMDPETPAENADFVDHLAERVIMETLMPGDEAADPGAAAVAGVMQAITAAPEKTYDFKEIACDYGVSYSTFQRRWREFYTEPPGQYLLRCRISECCRLLAETGLPVVAVGRQLGFDDPAYFSRIFKQRIGMPPSEYRVLHRPGLQ